MNIASRTFLASLAAAALLAGTPLFAQAQGPQAQTSVNVQPGSATGSRTMKVEATIVGLNPGNRTITLKSSQGRVFDVAAGEEVRNFDKLNVGDKVKAEYTLAASIALKKGGKAPSQATDTSKLDRAPGGAPGGVAARTLMVLADVTAVDMKRQVVTLRGPEGHFMEMTIADPEQLKNIKKGDQVEATYTESLAVSVEPAVAKK